MIYLFIKKNHIQSLFFKKSILGQYETRQYEKSFSVPLFSDKEPINTDMVASAVKDIFTHQFPEGIKDREVTLILQGSGFQHIRTEAASDLSTQALTSFVQEKINHSIPGLASEYSSAILPVVHGAQQTIHIFLILKKNMSACETALRLLDMKIIQIIPESLAYFKLFDRTMRKEKKELFLFCHYASDIAFGYRYDSFGPLDGVELEFPHTKDAPLEKALKAEAVNQEGAGQKINRLILSGDRSETVRQDMFTKHTGMWTNPLKKIVGTFYENYLSLLVAKAGDFPLLSYDACFGAFIFSQEHKDFGFQTHKESTVQQKNVMQFSRQKQGMNRGLKRDFIIVFISFVASCIFFLVVSRLLPVSPFQLLSGVSQPTPTIIVPTRVPSPSPTPSINRDSVKVKILNGGGVVGKATEVKDILNAIGYKDIVKDNADSFDYELTIVRSKTASIGAAIQSDIKDYAPKSKKETLAEKEDADVVVIIGKDFK